MTPATSASTAEAYGGDLDDLGQESGAHPNKKYSSSDISLTALTNKSVPSQVEDSEMLKGTQSNREPPCKYKYRTQTHDCIDPCRGRNNSNCEYGSSEKVRHIN